MVENRILLSGHDVSAGGLVTTLLEMNFPNTAGGVEVDLSKFEERDPARLLFSEDPAVVVQISADNIAAIEMIADEFGVVLHKIGKLTSARDVKIKLHKRSLKLDIDKYRDIWFKTSYLFDKHQVGDKLALERFENYSKQPLVYKFPEPFEGIIGKNSSSERGDKVAAIIREKGSNGEREMAWALYLAGFAVKDVHMTDLVSGRETLEDVNMIVFVGGFSNADTLGSAKGWAGAFLYNEKAAKSLENFYAREDTLSLGVCNGCQLMAELGLITPENKASSPKMKHNNSHKYESAFVGVTIEDSPSVMLNSLQGSSLGIWVAHGEGKFSFPSEISNYNIALRYNYNEYPANPNGSPEAVAGVCSPCGRHLAMMPHPERCLYPHNWAHYPAERLNDQVTPWLGMFENAIIWLRNI
jgi:phosphoribosylformylglycinamidine synthase